MERWYAIADAIVLVFGLLLMAAMIGVFAALGIIVLRSSGIPAGMVALVPAAIILTAAGFALHSWYRAL